jgi:hypothetical protein
VIDGGTFTINSQDQVTGNGVMFVLKNGASLKWNGGSAISLTAPTVSQLAAMGITDNRLAGMLVFEDRASTGARDAKINGNSSTVLNGKIYMSKSDVDIQGSATVTSQCLMIVGLKVTITGNGSLGSFCPTGQTVTDSLGSSSARVYLVA